MGKAKSKKHRKKSKSIFFTFAILVVTLVGIIAINTTLNNNLDTRSKAEERPFFGCVSGGEWLCACEVPGKGWEALECSLMEDKEGKQKWIDHCGGDAEKARIQWLWDMATRDGRVDPTCCGGQNVCGSLIPPRGGGGGGGNIPPWETPPPIPTVAIPTLIPSPTLAYSVPTQSATAPTTIIYYLPPTLPPYNPPTNIPYVPPTLVIQPTSTPKPVAKPIINIDIKKNVEEMMNFVARTQKSLVDFFSKVLP